MNIVVLGYQLEFVQVPMRFHERSIVNLFAQKNNKTLTETLSARRYTRLSEEVQRRYSSSLNEKLGEFLYRLKILDDSLYLRFLNEHGDKVFCDFSIEKTVPSKTKGIYCFTTGEGIKYAGRSHDPFERRLNQGYGHISPKNCYLDGQSTNCHVNSLIAEVHDVVSFYVCSIDDDSEIDRLERLLIKSYEPEWNIRLYGDA